MNEGCDTNEYQLSPIQYTILNKIKKSIPSENYSIDKNNVYINDIDSFKILKSTLDDFLENNELDYIKIDEIKIFLKEIIIIDLGDNEYIKIHSKYNIMEILKHKIEKIIG